VIQDLRASLDQDLQSLRTQYPTFEFESAINGAKQGAAEAGGDALDVAAAGAEAASASVDAIQPTAFTPQVDLNPLEPTTFEPLVPTPDIDLGEAILDAKAFGREDQAVRLTNAQNLLRRARNIENPDLRQRVIGRAQEIIGTELGDQFASRRDPNAPLEGELIENIPGVSASFDASPQPAPMEEDIATRLERFGRRTVATPQLPPGSGVDAYVTPEGQVQDMPNSDPLPVDQPLRSEVLRAQGFDPINTRRERESQDASLLTLPEVPQSAFDELAALEDAYDREAVANREAPLREEIEAATAELTERIQPALDSLLKPNWKAPADLRRDDALTWLAKIGGVDRQEAIAQGIDPSEIKRAPVGQRSPFRRGPMSGDPGATGLSFDGLAERMQEEGFQFDENSTQESQVTDFINTALAKYDDNKQRHFWEGGDGGP